MYNILIIVVFEKVDLAICLCKYMKANYRIQNEFDYVVDNDGDDGDENDTLALPGRGLQIKTD